MFFEELLLLLLFDFKDFEVFVEVGVLLGLVHFVDPADEEIGFHFVELIFGLLNLFQGDDGVVLASFAVN